MAVGTPCLHRPTTSSNTGYGIFSRDRWLTHAQAIVATQVTSRFPFNHGAPIHLGDPAKIGADLAHPLFGGPVPPMPDDLVQVFWACGVTPQSAAEAAKIELMITHAPAPAFITDLKADEFCIP